MQPLRRTALLTSLVLAAGVLQIVVDDDRVRAEACVDRLGASDVVGVAVDPATGAWCMDGTPINPGSRAEGLAMNVRAINAIIDDASPATADRWDYPSGAENEAWDDGTRSGASRNTAEFVAAIPSWSSYGLDLVTVGLQGGHPRFACSDQSGSGKRIFSQYDDASDDLSPEAKQRLRTLIAAAWAERLIVSVQLFYQNEADAEPNTDAEVIATIRNVTDWLEGLATTSQGSVAPNGFQNIVIEVTNESVNADSYGASPDATSLDPVSLATRIDEIHERWPGAFVTANLGTSERSGSMTSGQNDAFQSAIDWVSLHGNGISGSSLAGRIERSRSDPDLKGKPVVVTEDLWGHIQGEDGAVLAPFDDGYAVNPNLEATVDAGAGWGYYEQGCEGGEGGTEEPYGDTDQGNPTGNLYANGFQSPPINWAPTSGGGAKIDFFTDVSAVTSSGPTASPSPTVSPSPTTSPTAGPSPTTSPSPVPTKPAVRELAALDTGGSASSYTVAVPAPQADEVVVVVVGSTTNKPEGAPEVSGLRLDFNSVTQASFQVVGKIRSRVDAFIGTGDASSGTLTMTFGETQDDVHIAVLGVRNGGAPVTIGDASSADGSGTVGLVPLNGASSSRVIVTVLHGADEGSQPENGSLELADTAHASRPSGMATAWWPKAFEATPSYSWATPSDWGGVALELTAANG